MKNIISMEELLEKVKKIKESGSFDLSMEEDLSIAIMNLVSLEEHFYFTAEKTGKNEYFDLLAEVREIRKKLLAKMIDQHEGETWCISKHLLAATMRLIEVGTKLKSTGKNDEAEKTWKEAYRIYALFWGLRLKLINISDIKKSVPKLQEEKPKTKEEVINKLLDCCNE